MIVPKEKEPLVLRPELKGPRSAAYSGRPLLLTNGENQVAAGTGPQVAVGADAPASAPSSEDEQSPADASPRAGKGAAKSTSTWLQRAGVFCAAGLTAIGLYAASCAGMLGFGTEWANVHPVWPHQG